MRYLTAFCAIFLAASTSSAQESYTLKFKLDPDIGKSIQYRSSDVSTGSIKIFDESGKLLAEPKKEGDEIAYRQTVLERDKDGKATKFIRVYEKANEKEEGKTKTFTYEGRTLLFEKVGGKFRIGVVGEANLDSKDVRTLLKKVEQKSESEALLRNLAPGKPVKVGDSWSVPVKPVAEAIDDMKIDVAKSSISAKLVKVYKKDKSQFGVIDVALKMSVLESSEEGASMKFDPPGEFNVKLTMDLAIDGSTTQRKESGELALKGEAQMQTSGQKLKLVFDMKGTGGDERSAEIDDAKARVIPKVAYMAAPGEWTLTSNKDHGFSAKYPGTPEKKVKKDKSGITTTEYSVTSPDLKLWYSVNVTDYPDSVKVDSNSAYANLKKNPALKEANDVKIEGLPAVELKQEVDQKKTKVVVLQRVLIVEQRMYQLLIAAEEGTRFDAKQFFDSFKLLEKPKVKDN